MNIKSSSNNQHNNIEFLHHLTTDPEFLLRLTLTHDWDRAATFCQGIVDHVGGIDSDNDDTIFNETSQLATQQLCACDPYGNSVLQAACYYRPPAFVVSSILQAAGACHCQASLLAHCAHVDQSTALQVACATGADIRVLELLLQCCGSKGSTTGSPPHSRKVNRTRRFKERYQNTTSAHPTTLTMLAGSDQQGSTPVSELVVQYTLERRGPFHARRSRPLDAITHLEQELQDSPIFRVFWNKLRLLLRSAAKGSSSATTTNQQHQDGDRDEEAWLMHYGAACLAATCPPVVWHLLSLLPHSETNDAARQQQQLVLAALQPPAPTHPILQRQLYHGITHYLLPTNATTHTHATTQYLMTALESGHAWPLVSYLVEQTSTTIPASSFVHAALYSTRGLDTVYGLLRRNPQALSQVRR